MRGIRTAGVGMALALGATPALAQTPTPTPAPAATLGKAVPAGERPAEPVVRGAAPDALFPRPAYRTQTGGQPGGGTLPPPKPVEGQPNVTETRTPPGGTGVPGPVTPGYPSYVTPGTYPAYQPSYTVPGPAVGGPVCDPYYPGGAAVPVAPAPPGALASDGGFYAQPRLEDPYWGPANPLFPRVRTATSALLAPFTRGQGRFVVGGEYLLWWVRAQDAPALVTTSSPAFNGIIGQGDTRVLYGNNTLVDTQHNGARFSAAYWFNDLWALDGNVWFLARNAGGFSANSNDFPVLARPFVNANTGANFSEVISSPGLATGSALVESETSLWGAELNARRALICLPCARVDALLGFRNFNLNETLSVTERFARVPGSNTGIGVPTVTDGIVNDRFRTENHFYGVNVGLAGELRRGWWYLAGRVGVGLGTMNQQAEISGFQQLNTTTGPLTAQGGLLAVPGANIGRFSQNRFGAVTDAGLTLGVYVTPNLRLGIGYNLMYVNSVVRPAGQIDPALDVSRIPNFPVGTVPAVNGVRPSVVPLRTTDFFTQGITFSLMWSF
jgi:hypothetical protein